MQTCSSRSVKATTSGVSSIRPRACKPRVQAKIEAIELVAVVVITLTVARTAGVWLSLIGNREKLSNQTKAFMSWFGPKGVATMTYSLLLLGMGIPGVVEVTNLAALCVVTSIIAHGLTDTPGVNWIGRRAEQRRRAALADGLPVPPDAVV